MDYSLPAPSFRKELQELDDKWAVRMARLEALITMGLRPSPQQPQPSFSLVKVPVPHQAPQGSLSQTPFLQSSVPSGQAGPASGSDRTQSFTQTSMQMSSPLQNLYPDTEAEPVFQHPGLVAATVPSSAPFQFPARVIMSPDKDKVEEVEVSEPDLEPEDQPDSDSGEKDKIMSEDQNYRETVRGESLYGMVTYPGSGIFSNLQDG